MIRLTWKSLLLHDPGGEGRWACPFPECVDKPVDTAHRSLTVDPDTGAYLCHRCGRKGKLGITRTHSAGTSASASESRLRALAGDSGGWREIWDTSFSAPADGWVVPYLKLRGFESIDQGVDIRWNPSFYKEPSIMFGVRNWTGELIGCQGRRIDPQEGHSKVCTAKGGKSGLFLSSPAAILADPFIICESPIDALSLEVMGFPAVSVQGTQLPEWIDYLTYFRRVAVAPDNDEVGQKAAQEWRNKIISRSSNIVVPPFGKDWNESMLADKFGTQEYLRREITYITRGFHPMLDCLKKFFGEEMVQ